MRYNLNEIELKVYNCIREIMNPKGMINLTEENNHYIVKQTELMPDQVKDVFTRFVRIGMLRQMSFSVYVLNQ